MGKWKRKKIMWKTLKAFQLYYIFDCRNGTCVRMYNVHRPFKVEFQWDSNVYRVSGIRNKMELSLQLLIKVSVSERLLRIFIALFIHLICGVGDEIQFIRFEYRKQLLFNTFHWISGYAPFYNWKFKSTNQFRWKNKQKIVQHGKPFRLRWKVVDVVNGGWFRRPIYE